MKKIERSEMVLAITFMIIILVLLIIPTGFKDNTPGKSTRAKALVLSTDNSGVRQRGIVREGTQDVYVKILTGKFKGKKLTCNNNLKGQLELDKMFSKGDKALVVIGYSTDKIEYINIVDFYRINLELFLVIIFAVFLISFSGWTGVKSLLSFIFTILMIWKILIPSFLKGWNPVIVSLIVTTILIFATTYLVAGVNKKALVAFLGALSGIISTCLLALFFGKLFKIHGAVVPFSETLLYSGYGNLDLTQIFLAGIFISSSGAIMDVTMDISVAVHEVVCKNTAITRKEAITSGFSISKAVLGTMTTTLLLAYSGGYTAMLMVFMAQGTPVINIINLTYVSSEILHTMVGSFGLILVAPFTAVISGIVYTAPEYVSRLKSLRQ